MILKEKHIFDKLYRENILATLTMYNYYIISFTDRKDIKKVEYFSKQKDKLTNKVTDLVFKAKQNAMLAKKLRNKLENSVDMLSTKNQKEVEDLLKYLEKLEKKYSQENIKELEIFLKLVLTTYFSEQNGKPVKFDDIPKEYREGIEYEFSTDVYVNLYGYTNLGEDLSYLYYRSRLIKRDMPMFITSELKQKYQDIMEEIFVDGRGLNYPLSSKIPKYRELYDVTITQKDKELYESVFPEFNFKFEDIEQDPPVYELQFDKFKDYYE